MAISLLSIFPCAINSTADYNPGFVAYAEAEDQSPDALYESKEEDEATQNDPESFENEGSPAFGEESINSSETEADKISLTLGMLIGENAVLNPLECVYADLQNINSLVFESLVALDSEQKPAALLADRWTSEGKTWTFALRNNLIFHNGAQFTANDVIASYNRILEFGEEGAYYKRVQLIDSMEAVNDHTLKVTAKRSGDMLLYAMTFPIVQSGSLNDALPRGTGPFWYISYQSGNQIQLEANPLWWKKSGKLQKIVAIAYPDTSTMLSALETREIQVLTTRNLSASINRNLSDRMVLDYYTQTYEYIVPNLENSTLQNRNVRQAIMYAINRENLAETVYLNMVTESEVPVVPGSWLFETQSTKYNYSPERALQLLNEAGWYDTNGDGLLDRTIDGLNENLTLRLITYNEPHGGTRTDAINFIAQQLGVVGIQVEVSTLKKNEVKKALNEKDFDLALIAYSLPDTPDLSPLLASDGKANFSSYGSTTMDELLNEARTAQGEEELSSALSKIQLLVVEDLPIMGFFFRNGVLISTESLGGLKTLRAGEVYRGLETWQMSE